MARFAICDHFSPVDFSPDEYLQFRKVIDQERIEVIPVSAADMIDLLSMRNILVQSQVAIIAAARKHHGLLVSNCRVFRRMAQGVLKKGEVLWRQSCGNVLLLIEPIRDAPR